MKFVAATKKRHVDRSGDISTSLRGGKTDAEANNIQRPKGR